MWSGKALHKQLNVARENIFLHQYVKSFEAKFHICFLTVVLINSALRVLPVTQCGKNGSNVGFLHDNSQKPHTAPTYDLNKQQLLILF